MQEYPKVTAIIPNYNHAIYLKKRIDSVLLQTYPNLEVIILDDCSSDNSREIIETYRSNPLVKEIIYNSQNSGSTFYQWKKGATLATGEWIWFAESDDYSELTFVEDLIKSNTNNKSVGLIYCDSKIITEDTIQSETFAQIKNKAFNTERWSTVHSNSGSDEIEQFLLKGGTINNSSAVLFKKELLLKVNPFDLPLKLIGDKYAFVKILALSDVHYVNKSLNYYRDPFTVKKNNLHYAHEQFLVFSWVYKNVKLRNKKSFYEPFFVLTRVSPIKDWGIFKLKCNLIQFFSNPWLFTLSSMYSAFKPIQEKIK